MRSGSTRARPPRGGVYFLGGIHAREWGSPDILINFVRAAHRRLPRRHRHQPGRDEPGRWEGRRDRRQPGRGRVPAGQPGRPPPLDDGGSDVAQEPAPGRARATRTARSAAATAPAWTSTATTTSCGTSRRSSARRPRCRPRSIRAARSTAGRRPVSEPETANVAWLLDRVPSVGYFIDIHSFGEDILYNWGDDDDQTTDPAMNFRNPAFDGKRGITDSTPGGDPGEVPGVPAGGRPGRPHPAGHRHARRHRGRARPAVQRQGRGRALPDLGHVRRLRVLAQLRRRRQGQGAAATPSNGDPNARRSPRASTPTTRTWSRSSRRSRRRCSRSARQWPAGSPPRNRSTGHSRRLGGNAPDDQVLP